MSKAFIEYLRFTYTFKRPRKGIGAILSSSDIEEVVMYKGERSE